MEAEHWGILIGGVYLLGIWIGSGILSSNKKTYLLTLLFLALLLGTTAGIPFVLFDSLQPIEGWDIWSFEGWEELFYLAVSSFVWITLMVVGIYVYSTIVFLVYLVCYLWYKHRTFDK